MITRGQLALIGALLLVAIACFATWKVQGWRYEAQLADQALLHQQDLATISNAAAAQARNALEKQQAAEQALHDLDTTRLKERTDDLNENERLRLAVADGDRRLRITGSCRAGGGDVPGTASASGVGDAGAVELSRETGQAVLDLRRDLIADQAALRAAQAYIKELCR
ncbi:Bacteriophage lysis protein [compost metagenome]